MEHHPRQFLEDLLADSVMLEQRSEPGQAFDKLARGIESRLPVHDGDSQREKAARFFARALDDAPVWQCFTEHAIDARRFTSELAFQVKSKDVNSGRREEVAWSLAHFFMLLRNKRFHGYADFSGRVVRASATSGFLRVLRCCLENELARQAPGAGQ